VLNEQLNPDTSVCDSAVSEEDCLSHASTIEPSKKTCIYDSDAAACTFDDSSTSSLFALLVLSILSTMFAVLPMMFIEYLVENYLLPPVIQAAPADEGEGETTAADEDEEADDNDDNPMEQMRLGNVVVTKARRFVRMLTGGPVGDDDDDDSADGTPAQVDEDRYWKKRVAREMAKVVLTVQDQRNELLEEIDLLESALPEHEPSRSLLDRLLCNRRESPEARGLRKLRAFLVRFDGRWGFTPEGYFPPPTRWQKWTRTTQFDRLERRVVQELRLQDQITAELEELGEVSTISFVTTCDATDVE
jgi:hypothetical protein